MIAAQFLRNLIAAVPYAIHTVLTDNGIPFTNRARDNCRRVTRRFDVPANKIFVRRRQMPRRHVWQQRYNRRQLVDGACLFVEQRDRFDFKH